MVQHEASFWTEFPRTIVVTLSISMAIFGVLFFFLFSIPVLKFAFKAAKTRKNMFYWILGNICILDCIELQGMVMAAIMSLTKHKSFPLIFEITSAIHAVYEWTLHMIGFLLALKVLFAVFKMEMKYTSATLKFLVLFVWKALLINLHVNHVVDISFEYTFNVINFSVVLPNPKAVTSYKILFYINLVFLCLGLICYLAVLLKFFLKKLFKKEAIEDYDLLMFYQGLATFLPGATYFILNAFIDSHVAKASLALSVFMTLLPRLIPVFNLVGLLVINNELKSVFLSQLKKKFKCCCCSKSSETTIDAKDMVTLRDIKTAQRDRQTTVQTPENDKSTDKILL
ncbi:hypothetical protein L596_026385 [Steinernema carpocapsae]|uniref:G-protein coupled receptors family 1 profile domain-containing protein n=1 Tax=Steinernema carpocapsae TaxID=34508 RepID=A0A4U5M188_STECR|nr:hypothetical protein L596_026385 [Steinernema carpocapsae]